MSATILLADSSADARAEMAALLFRECYELESAAEAALDDVLADAVRSVALKAPESGALRE